MVGMGREKGMAAIALALLVLASGGVWAQVAAGAEPAAGASAALRQIDQVACEDFSWVPRKLAGQPEYKSQNVRYCIWVLGEGRKSVMTLAWDESGGTGSGYDTLYVDTDFSGDLNAPGKRFFWENWQKGQDRPQENYDVKGVKEAGGEKVYHFRFRCVTGNDQIEYDSEYSVADGNGTYSVGPLPGNQKLQWASDLATAPIYHLGGAAVPIVNGKFPGRELVAAKVGQTFQASTVLAYLGERPELQLRFYGSKFPGLEAAVRELRWGGGAYPMLYLRVRDAAGKVIEEIPFGDSCPCAGGFAPELLVPTRVPSGVHTVVVRLLRRDDLGGQADYIWPLTVENPDFGKPLADPAWELLAARFGAEKVEFASLRRSAAPADLTPSYPQEHLYAAAVADTTINPSNRDWDSSVANFGSDRTLSVGLLPWSHASSRSLLRFDLSGLPAGAKVVGAAVRLTLTAGGDIPSDASNAKVVAYALRRPWNETPAPEGHACWQGPIFRGNSNIKWGKPGADDTQSDRYEAPSGSTEIGQFPRPLDPANTGKDAPRESVRMIALDVSQTVRQWQEGTLPNYGLVLTLESKGFVNFLSSEIGDYPYRPTLVVAYTRR